MRDRDTGKMTTNSNHADNTKTVRKPMTIYEIEQYEIHTMKYRVEASSEAEAIKMLFDGEADAVDNSLDFIEISEDMGPPADDHRELADQLRSHGVSVGEHVIPSIRSVEVE